MSDSESSPLLGFRNAPSYSPFPTIQTAIHNLGPHPDRAVIDDIIPAGVDDSVGTSFKLVVLLQLRANKLNPPRYPDSDVWTRWNDATIAEVQVEELDRYLRHTLDDFLFHPRTSLQLERLLWTPFLQADDSSRASRVVDFLADCPLLSHDVVMLSVDHVWRHGPQLSGPLRGSDSASRFDEICTPRVLHAVDLVAHLFYFGVVVSYVMHPPYETVLDEDDDPEIQRTGWREIVLVIFAAAILTRRPWAFSKVPTLTLFIVFLANIPSVPFAGSASFDILLLCFALHAFQFHFPTTPSPLFLFKRSLPFAAFLVDGFYHIIIPPIMFFLPIFILITTWLSMALSETFFMPTSLATLIPTPIQTRTTVLYLFFILVSAISSSLLIIVVHGRNIDPTARGWDTYGDNVARRARASFVRAVMAYASPHTFPAPFSLLNTLFVIFPSLVWTRLLGRPLVALFSQAEKQLWRWTVCPFAFVCWCIFYFLPCQKPKSRLSFNTSIM
ncbi:hypothetical protein MKEN_00885600 [Mycena kentingensis (nom. inval.)]|nr:hypothetical protein MKEN_00885600 [Mycena kentingensis (nom. inval.)]